MLASSHGFFHVMYILRDHLALRVPLKSQYGHNWKLLTGQRTAQSRQIFWKKWILQNVYKIRANNLFSIRLSSCVYLSCCCLVTAMSDSFATPWTVIRNTPLSMGFPRQEHQSGLLFPSPHDPGVKPGSPALQADSLPSELPGKPTNQLAVLQTYETISLKRVEGNVLTPATLEISMVFKTKNKLYITTVL